STPLLFLGILVALASSWWGLIVAPSLQLGSETTVLSKETGQHYPPNRPGLAQQGAAIYRSEGCNSCHSQVVRPEGFGLDLARGWGKRRTVARDYLRDQPVMLGSVRIGPDLANIGFRMGAGDTNAQPVMVKYHLKHLYHPRTVAPGSVMPAYPYLFEKRAVQGSPSPLALSLEGAFAPPQGYEIVPKPEAIALVHYLLSLKSGVSLAEAPVPPPPTNTVAAASATTNAPSASTPSR
ncbi:MAG: cbb3-type cytochrome c oxidase subunit II, partial [Verrucomicrobiales bacterium]|nr:cbb3-type cytochrome c oxidase subunit II [Verrucomicrobiales bacterium]